MPIAPTFVRVSAVASEPEKRVPRRFRTQTTVAAAIAIGRTAASPHPKPSAR